MWNEASQRAHTSRDATAGSKRMLMLERLTFLEDQQLRLIAGLFGDFEGDEDGGNLRDECEERLVLGGARRVSLGTAGRKGAMGGLRR